MSERKTVVPRDPASLNPDELREAVAVEVMGWTGLALYPTKGPRWREVATLHGRPPGDTVLFPVPLFEQDTDAACEALDRATEMVTKAGGPRSDPAWNRIDKERKAAGFCAEIRGTVRGGDLHVIESGATRAEAAARAALAAVRSLRGEPK